MGGGDGMGLDMGSRREWRGCGDGDGREGYSNRETHVPLTLPNHTGPTLPLTADDPLDIGDLYDRDAEMNVRRRGTP